jgi:zinc protease
VAVRVWLRGGLLGEQIPGQALLTGRLLAEGTRRRDWRAIGEQTESRGVDLVSFAGREVSGVAVNALAGDWRVAVEWARELVFEPSFPGDRLAWLRRQTVAELLNLGDQPEVKTGWEFLRQLYHPHPWSRPLQGTPDSLAEIRKADCDDFHRRCRGAGMVVTVAGDIDLAAVGPLLEESFGLAAGEAPQHGFGEPEAPAGLGEVRRELETDAVDQAHVYLGHLTVGWDDPALPALDLIGVILGAGAGVSGRLPERIRETEGWAYALEVATAAGAGLQSGRLEIYAAVAPDNVARLERAVREELERLLEDGFNEQELDQAKAYLVGCEPFRRETARQWSEILAEAALYDRPVDDPEWVRRRWLEVSPTEAMAAARRFLRPEDLRVTVGWPRGARR